MNLSYQQFEDQYEEIFLEQLQKQHGTVTILTPEQRSGEDINPASEPLVLAYLEGKHLIVAANPKTIPQTKKEIYILESGYDKNSNYYRKHYKKPELTS